MTYAEFQKHWEEASSAERQGYDSLPIENLISLVKHHDFGDYYQIWYSLGNRASIEEVGPLLINILRSDDDYLTRYHCATCLLTIFNPFPSIFRPEKLCAKEKYFADQHIGEYEEEMNKKLQEGTG